MFADALNGDSARRPGERVIRWLPGFKRQFGSGGAGRGIVLRDSDDELGIFTGLGFDLNRATVAANYVV